MHQHWAGRQQRDRAERAKADVAGDNSTVRSRSRGIMIWRPSSARPKSAKIRATAQTWESSSNILLPPVSVLDGRILLPKNAITLLRLGRRAERTRQADESMDFAKTLAEAEAILLINSLAKKSIKNVAATVKR